MAEQEPDKSFAAAETWFAISLLRQARARATSRPAPEGQYPDEAIDTTAAEAHRRLLKHLVALPEDRQRDATSVILWAMILEYLHATKRHLPGWQRA